MMVAAACMQASATSVSPSGRDDLGDALVVRRALPLKLAGAPIVRDPELDLLG